MKSPAWEWETSLYRYGFRQCSMIIILYFVSTYRGLIPFLIISWHQKQILQDILGPGFGQQLQCDFDATIILILIVSSSTDT